MTTLLACIALSQNPSQVYLSDMDLKNFSQGWGSPQKNLSVDGKPLSIGKRSFAKGVGTHAVSKVNIDLGKDPQVFHAVVGVDDEVGSNPGDVVFHVIVDGVEKFNSGLMRAGDAPKEISILISGAKKMTLKVDNGGDEINYDHADWADAYFLYYQTAPKTLAMPQEKPYILTPKAPLTPRINGPAVLGAGANRDFVWRVPATGSRPMKFSATGLPSGLKLDSKTGTIRGTTPAKGNYAIDIRATNKRGKSHRTIKLVVGSKLALTPPMGWNSWNCFATAVDEKKVRSAADAFINSGLVNHGWQYINIDDCWSTIPNSNDPVLGGPQRTPQGDIITNKKFPDMKGLNEYIHSLGLRSGIYSSPGPITCGGYTASYNREFQDARSFAEWGFDYLKYDWCSYTEIKKTNSLSNLKQPYATMRRALNTAGRDIVFSLCQYGMGDVWEWGDSVGGNCWRTTGDITDSWESMSGIGFSQNGHERFAGPGNWNDPDMLVVGWVGWGPQLHPTRLSPSEQYTHISLWALLAAPLLIGCDLTKLDDFTLNLLTNDEVIAVDQDPLGKAAKRISKTGEVEVWARPLADGSTAVGIFNLGDDATSGSFTFALLGLAKKNYLVRDLWRQVELGKREGDYKSMIRAHGCELLRIH